jgi:hypothetical protein
MSPLALYGLLALAFIAGFFTCAILRCGGREED